MTDDRTCPIESGDIGGLNGLAARDGCALLASASDIAARVTCDLIELRVVLDHVGSEEEAGFVGEIAGEFEEFAQHLAGLKEKRAGLPSRALQILSVAPQTPRFCE